LQIALVVYEGTVWQLLADTGLVARLFFSSCSSFPSFPGPSSSTKIRSFRASPPRVAGIPEDLPAEQEAFGYSELLSFAQGEPAAGSLPGRIQGD